MGINTHTGSLTHQSGGGYLKGHIDFCALECYGAEYHMWNQNGTNNGTKAEICPYMASDLRTYLTTTVYNALPSELKAVIVDKYAYIEGRYSASGQLKDSGNYFNKRNLGKVWAPTEYEVFGSTIYGTESRSEGQAVQYPLFRSQGGRNLLGCSDDGSGICGSISWWTASVAYNSSENCIYVHDWGYACIDCADCEFYVPLCFRIAQA